MSRTAALLRTCVRASVASHLAKPRLATRWNHATRFASTMKAAVVEELGKPLVVKDVPIPEPSATNVLAKVLACGVCHTDLHAAEGDWSVKAKTPFIPGHEAVARVEKVGSAVSAVKVGDLIGVPWLASACNHCEYCLSGKETVCPHLKNSGFHVNGGFAEYVLADPEFVAHIPDGADAVQIAPILCAGLTVYKGLKSTDAKAGEWIVVTGLGGLGQLGVQYAKAMGFNVIGVDIDDSKLAKVKKDYGADYVINAKTEDPVAFIKEKTGGAHAALVTAVSNSAFSQALGFVRPFGNVTLIGLPPGDFPLDILNTVLNSITVRGSIVGTRIDMIEALGFFMRGQVKSDIVTDKLENINEIFDKLKTGKVSGRIVLDFQ